MKAKLKPVDMTYIALFAVVIAACAWISVPATVSFTMQTFGVFVTVGTLGGKRGTLAVLVYLLLGAFGAPVFAGFTGGIGCLLGSTGGYIVGFLAAALVMWGLEPLWGKTRLRLALSMAAGLLVCYLFGTVWFMAVYAGKAESIGMWAALCTCVFPYVLPDLLKIALALALCKRLSQIVKPGKERQ